MASTEPNEPTDPIEHADPTLPMDSTEFRDPIDSTDPLDHSDSTDLLTRISSPPPTALERAVGDAVPVQVILRDDAEDAPGPGR